MRTIAQICDLHLVRYRFEFSVLLGNHDKLDDLAGRDFLRTLAKPQGLYYSTTIGRRNCLVLDSSSGEIGSEQLTWLGEELSKVRGPLVVFVHHPVLDLLRTLPQ